MDSVNLKSRIQTIFYEDKQNNLAKQFVTAPKRLSRIEAGDILLDRGIEYKEILKVTYEYMHLEIPVAELEQYLVETTQLRKPRA